MITARPKSKGSVPPVAFQIRTATAGDFRRPDEDEFPDEVLRENLEEVVLAPLYGRLEGLLLESEDASVTAGAASRARFALKLLLSGVSNQGAQWRPPLISASWDGEAVLEWWVANRKLTLYCSEDETTYIKTSTNDDQIIVEDGPAGALMELWGWLTDR